MDGMHAGRYWLGAGRGHLVELKDAQAQADSSPFCWAASLLLPSVGTKCS
jgi:hypothetical protein